MTDRSCPGFCCQTVYLPMDHANLHRFADVLIDGHQIADMLEPTGETTGTSHHFTCKNWDPNMRLCTVYENRPFMCRDYPYGRPCEHCGLTDGIPGAERLALERQEATS
jgi:Fe-S-cluster containining protein